MQPGVGLTVDSGPRARGEPSGDFLAADAAAPVGRAAVAGMDFNGRSSVADAEFTIHSQGMPDPQGGQAAQIGRQVIERIFDSDAHDVTEQGRLRVEHDSLRRAVGGTRAYGDSEKRTKS